MLSSYLELTSSRFWLSFEIMATMQSATSTQRVNESITIPPGANASHSVLKGCKSYITRNREEAKDAHLIR